MRDALRIFVEEAFIIIAAFTYRFANQDARKACSYYMVIVRER
jgi:hypothetical protein